MDFIPEDIASLLIGVFILISMIYGALGFIQSVKSIRKKEEDGFKKWASFVINLGFVLFLFSSIITNIFDVFRALGVG